MAFLQRSAGRSESVQLQRSSRPNLNNQSSARPTENTGTPQISARPTENTGTQMSTRSNRISELGDDLHQIDYEIKLDKWFHHNPTAIKRKEPQYTQKHI